MRALMLSFLLMAAANPQTAMVRTCNRFIPEGADASKVGNNKEPMIVGLEATRERR